MMWERQDEFVRWILSSSVACSQSTAVYFVTVGLRQCPDFAVRHMRKHCFSESDTLLSYPSLGPVCEVELSNLLVAVKMCCMVKTSSQLTLLTFMTFIFIIHF
ncbi:hypothetical protein AMECASPLE_003190 [Ameca splendens]|uniref:Uncharacterized protein n=1 Tax=Ameca splendens TaxID=208324 RepID=A0ABV0YWL3_9TELE